MLGAGEVRIPLARMWEIDEDALPRPSCKRLSHLPQWLRAQISAKSRLTLERIDVTTILRSLPDKDSRIRSA